MKLKIICVVLTVSTIAIMWKFSPRQKYLSRPEVETISVKTESVHNIVIARGRIEEQNKKSIRLDKTATVETLYVKQGDFVEKGTVLADVTEKANAVNDIVQVTNFLPEINDVSDLENFYIPSKIDETTTLTPHIKAPISGVITNLSIKEGDIAIGQMPIITISDFNDLCIKASVSELYIKDIKKGQKAEVTGEAFSGKKHIAYVKEINPVATQKTSITGSSDTSIEITLAFTSKTVDLRPGYSVNARIYTETHNDALTIPYTAVFQEDNKEYVFTLSEDKLVKKSIKTGFELEDRVEIISGVSKSDIIVNNPKEKLEDNMQVRISNS